MTLGTGFFKCWSTKRTCTLVLKLGWLSLLPLLSAPVMCGAQGQISAPEEEWVYCRVPLIAAIEKRDLQSAHQIMQAGANLNDDTCGITALTESIVGGYPQLAKELILAGADANLSDILGVSPLMYASFYCEAEIVSLLLERGANVNAIDSDGTSSLMDAASNCRDGNITALLIRSGAKVNLKIEGETALILAVRNGDEFAVKELVAAGADLGAKTDEGETALTIARDLAVGRKPEHERIYAFLRNLTCEGNGPAGHQSECERRQDLGSFE
jgi:hypothetical protein